LPNSSHFYFFADELKKLLEDRGRAFEECLHRCLVKSANTADNALANAQVTFFMYFDEAHVLMHVHPGARTPDRSKYHLLCRVLGMMNARSFFAVFLSTNSWLGAFAPSMHKMPSLRDWDNIILHAPFTELPFDTFAEDSFGQLERKNLGGVRLLDVCNLEYLVKFGRPL